MQIYLVEFFDDVAGKYNQVYFMNVECAARYMVDKQANGTACTIGTIGVQ